MKAFRSFRVAGMWGMAGAALATLLLVVASVPLRAQQAVSSSQTDPRWDAWLGCWEPVSGPVRAAGDTTGVPLVCVVPAPGSVGVDIAMVTGGKVVTRERVEATGEQRSVTREGCAGWESAKFSDGAQRVYLTAEYTCPGDLKRNTNELMAITPNGEWLDVRGAAVRSLPQGVRVVRYRAASGSAAVPSDLAWALQGSAMAMGTARDAAGAPPEPGDVVEASYAMQPAVVEAWLVEEGEPFALDGQRLVQLKDAGVSARVIDVMVALSYPRVFAIDLASHRAERRPPPDLGDYGRNPPVYGMGYGSPWGCYSPYSWDCNSPFGWGYYSPYAYSPFGYYSPYGYWSGYGFYPAGGVVVVSGGGGQAARHGRMVIGRGYTQGTAVPAGSRGSSRGASPSSRSTGGQRPSSRSGGSGSSPSSGSGSGGGGRRTVKP